MKMDVAQAVNTLADAFEKDPNFRYAYQSNIAMAFVDECRWHQERTGKNDLSNQDIHTIANVAADRFLSMLAGSKPEVTVVECPKCQRGEYCAENERYSALTA
jgi:hypothetical protein